MTRPPIQAGIQLALEAILVSPHFLFRVELDPAVNDAGQIPRSMNTNWPRGSPISSGAACPTTNCSTWRPAAPFA